jgi:putative redox protein
MGTITLRWVEANLMVGSDSNGHSVVIGRSPDPEFVWSGIKPSDLLLLAVASCAAYDVTEILTKQRQPLEGLKVLCDGDQLPDPPYKFTRIHLHFLARGKVEAEKLERAIRLSEEKYCSVVATLRPGVPITSDFEILP